MLLVVYIPPSLRAEAHRIKPMLIVTTNRVVVAVAMSNPIVVVSANMSPMSTGIRCACMPQGECKSESRKDYSAHRGLDELALKRTQ
jgi:hypothetical protein